MGILGAEFPKNYCHIWHQHPQICQFKNFWEKLMSKFGTKNALFGHFWVGILKEYCHILKSVPSNLSNCKISPKKQRCLNLGPEMPHFIFGYFGLEF